MQTEIHPSKNSEDSPDAEMLERFLEFQQRELQVRTEELQLRVRQEENGKRIAESSIAANLKDREGARQHVERRTKLLFVGSTAILAVLVCFAGFALYLGRENVVLKLVEIGAAFAAGFAGGYGIKSSRK